MMDDAAFQQELINLKRRVARMAATYQWPSSGMPPEPTSSDAFLYHLQDVKSRLQSMQSCLNCLTADQGTRNQSNWKSPSDADFDAYLSSSTFPSPQTRLALPSPPLFWQLFTALRSDVRSIDTRLADVEQGISDLEDRVDRLDPSQLTPAASDTEFPNAPNWSENYETISSGQEPCSSYATANTKSSRWAAQHVRQHPSELDGDYGAVDYGVSTTLSPFETMPFASSVHQARDAPAAEGVAFRDREIAQLEELVKGAHDNLKHSEAVGSQKDVEIEHLRNETSEYCAKLLDMERTLGDREATLSAYSRMLSERQLEIEKLHASSESKDEVIQNWKSKHFSLQQSCMRKKSQIAWADRQICQLQRALYNLQGNKQDEIDDIVASKDHEISRLRDFCESKDAVIYQQEQIISRGAALMEEKDDEIGHLSRELKGTKDDLQNETRQRERFSRLFEERGEVIEQLRISRNQALTPKPMDTTSEAKKATPEPPKKQGQVTSPPYSPFATVGREVHTPDDHKWTPKVINGYGKLPHEMKRAALWENGPESYCQSFGSPSIGRIPSQPTERLPETDTTDTRRLRHSASVKLLRRLALGEEAERNRTTQKPADRSNPRQVPSLDDLSRRPPLPAPLPPLRPRHGSHMSSTPAVHDDRRPISKHHSMQDLHRRKLHAYVEDETGGEQCGDA